MDLRDLIDFVVVDLAVLSSVFYSFSPALLQNVFTMVFAQELYSLVTLWAELGTDFVGRAEVNLMFIKLSLK